MKNQKPAPEAAPEVTTAIVEYSPTAAALADLSRRMANVVYDVSTPAGMAIAKVDRAEVRDLRVALEKKRVEIKAPALKRCNEIDTEAARIKAELLKYETPPDEAIKRHEAAIENERLAKVAAEEKRQRDIQGRIDDMRGAVNGALRARTSAEVVRILADVQGVVIDPELYAEFKAAADFVKSESVAEIERIRDQFITREAEAEQIRKDRAELDRQRAEQEARDKVERDRVATENAVKEEQFRKERAAFEAEQGAAREKDRQRQASIDAENAIIAAAQRAAQEVIDKANRELEARQQAERDAQAKRDREAAEAEERRVAAEQEQAAKVAAEAEEQRRKNWRPTFAEIITVVSQHYDRDHDTVRTWIAEPKPARKAA